MIVNNTLPANQVDNANDKANTDHHPVQHRRLGETLLHRVSQMTATDVARIGYQAMQHAKAVVVPGFINRLMIESIRFTPRAIVRQMSHRLMEV